MVIAVGLQQSLVWDKYVNAVLYFTRYCNNQYLGATKLNKLLYYLDFISYRDRTRSVTNDTYVSKQYGPVPRCIDDVLTTLAQEGKVSIEIQPFKDGETVKYTPKTDSEVSIFDDYERTLLKEICNEFLLWPTEKIVNQTHLEAPWFYSKPYTIVDYHYASDIEFFRR